MLPQLFGLLSVEANSLFAEEAFQPRQSSNDTMAEPEPASWPGRPLHPIDSVDSLADISLDALQELNDMIPLDPEAMCNSVLIYRGPCSRSLLEMATEHGLRHVVERLLLHGNSREAPYFGMSAMRRGRWSHEFKAPWPVEASKYFPHRACHPEGCAMTDEVKMGEICAMRTDNR